jgi:tRNA wybutosine-synthesizing protein 4
MAARDKTMFTAVDAFAAKKSATMLGYYEDKYLECMRAVAGPKAVRKQPIINRGYYTRVTCFRNIVHSFLEATKSLGPRQILNIGCGYDTNSFHLVDEGHPELSMFEVDYEDVILRKTDMIRRSDKLNTLLGGSGNPLGPNYGFNSPAIKFVAADLQQPAVTSVLVAAGLEASQPTLIISECVLVCKCIG